MIELKNVTYSYPQSSTPILKNLNAAFDAGEIVAITGRNGCGKTTVTKLITGVFRPDEGKILIDDEDISNMDLFEIGQRAGYVFQDPSRQLFCETVRAEIAYGLKNLGFSSEKIKETADYYMEMFHITHLADRFPGKLSQGEKQRVALAAVLSMGNRYVILDEPTTGLDMRSRKSLGMLLGQIRDEGRGVIIVSHEKEFCKKYVDRLWNMGEVTDEA